MGGKHATHEDTPLDGLVGLAEPENCLQLQPVVLARLLLRVVVEKVFIRRLIVLDVASAEFVDAFHFFGVGTGTLIKSGRLLFTLTDHPLSCHVALIFL